MKVLVKKGTTEPYYATDKSTKGQDGLEEGRVRIYPLGGGFAMLASWDDLEEVEYVAKMTKGYASIDFNIGYPAVNDMHYNWNGWAEPRFEESVMRKILSDCDAGTADPMVHLGTEDHDTYILENYAWGINSVGQCEEEDCADVCVFKDKDTGLCYVDGWTWSFTPMEKVIATYKTTCYATDIGEYLAYEDYPGIAVEELQKGEWTVTTLTAEADEDYRAHLDEMKDKYK